MARWATARTNEKARPLLEVRISHHGKLTVATFTTSTVPRIDTTLAPATRGAEWVQRFESLAQDCIRPHLGSELHRQKSSAAQVAFSSSSMACGSRASVE